MRNLSVRELGEMCEELSVKEFIFDSANNGDMLFPNAKVKLTFTIMMTLHNPESILFMNADVSCSLYLNRVKRIEMSEEKSMLGTIFTLICGGRDEHSPDISYTIIAR